jgi:hypothetical protein
MVFILKENTIELILGIETVLCLVHVVPQNLSVLLVSEIKLFAMFSIILYLVFQHKIVISNILLKTNNFPCVMHAEIGPLLLYHLR